MLASLAASIYGAKAIAINRFAGWQQARDRLRQGWQNGERPEPSELPALVRELAADQQRGALEDLIGEHLRLTWQAGRGPTLDSYAARADALPEPAPPWTASLVEDELLARCQLPHGDAPPLAEYARRFAGRGDVLQLLRARYLPQSLTAADAPPESEPNLILLERVGLGATALVWRAFDRRRGTVVAVKRARPPAASGPTAPAACPKDNPHAARLAHEARVTAGLAHPGIAAVLEYVSDPGGLPYCVVRWVDGVLLSQRIAEYHQRAAVYSADERRRAWHDLLRAFLDICEAVDHAHAQGVLHRDLKPGNVMVDATGQGVIIDWGLAQHLSAAADTSPVGTPEYMPPEQLDGCADPRSDVFGLGATLYELLAHRPPHAFPPGAEPAAWGPVVRAADIALPERSQPQIPWALGAICLRALARSPAARYAGPRELADDMRRYLTGRPIVAAPEPMGESLRRLAARLWS